MKYQNNFFPITATPFSRVGYKEVLPCRELLPYVRCFWTSDSHITDSLIIPDLCADVMIHIEYDPDSDNEGEISCIGFCGVGDSMFISQKLENLHMKIFGIRFYAWQAQNFADEKLAKTVNVFFEQTLSLSPKKTSSIIRYQSLWQEVCRSTQFDIQDSVFAYGYYDQAHLLNDFKKYHGISLSEARKLAFKS